jgi:hypothetical protein
MPAAAAVAHGIGEKRAGECSRRNLQYLILGTEHADRLRPPGFLLASCSFLPIHQDIEVYHAFTIGHTLR